MKNLHNETILNETLLEAETGKKIIDRKFIDGSLFNAPSYWIYLYEDGTVQNHYV